MREEAKKLEEFRANQKERRKKVGATGVQNRAHRVWVTGSDVVFSGGAKDGRAPQAEVLPVQEDNGGK